MKNSIDIAFTRPLAEKGVVVEVIAPDSETKLGTITVRGADSETFHRSLWEKQRRNVEILALPDSDKEAARKEAELDLIASLVAGWSFDDPCTPENIKKLLRNAPYVFDLVDRTAGKRELYWEKPRE